MLPSTATSGGVVDEGAGVDNVFCSDSLIYSGTLWHRVEEGAEVGKGAGVDDVFYSGSLIAIAGVDEGARVDNIFYFGTLSSSTPAPRVDDEAQENRYDYTLPYLNALKSTFNQKFNLTQLNHFVSSRTTGH